MKVSYDEGLARFIDTNALIFENPQHAICSIEINILRANNLVGVFLHPIINYLAGHRVQFQNLPSDRQFVHFNRSPWG